jgi:hypothetical protein
MIAGIKNKAEKKTLPEWRSMNNSPQKSSIKTSESKEQIMPTGNASI